MTKKYTKNKRSILIPVEEHIKLKKDVVEGGTIEARTVELLQKGRKAEKEKK